jgi:hypothetical protein
MTVPMLAAVDWNVERREYWRAVHAAERGFRLDDADSMVTLLQVVRPYGALTGDEFYPRLASRLTERIAVAGPLGVPAMRELIEECGEIVSTQEVMRHVPERRGINLLARFLTRSVSGSRLASV